MATCCLAVFMGFLPSNTSLSKPILKYIFLFGILLIHLEPQRASLPRTAKNEHRSASCTTGPTARCGGALLQFSSLWNVMNEANDLSRLTTVTLVFFFFMRRTRDAIWMVERLSEKSAGEAEMWAIMVVRQFMLPSDSLSNMVSLLSLVTDTDDSIVHGIRWWCHSKGYS